MIRYISENKIRHLLDEAIAFKLAKEALLLSARGLSLMPPKIYLTLPGNKGNDFRAMPAFLAQGKNSPCGIKWVSVFPGNRALGQATVNGLILLNCPNTGLPLAILQANTITALRTAAVAAVASTKMAIKNPSTLGIVGAGIQAYFQLRALTRCYRFKEIKIWGFLSHEAKKLCSRFPHLPNLRPVSSLEECVRQSDILVTCTPSKKPIVRKEWVKRGAHINAIGADAPGKEELEAAILSTSRVVVDDLEQASHSGEINVPLSKHEFSKKKICGELHEIVSGKKIGRGEASEITVFDSTGLAIFDIYYARYIYERLALKKPSLPRK